MSIWKNKEVAGLALLLTTGPVAAFESGGDLECRFTIECFDAEGCDATEYAAYAGESYDAAALILLAMAASGSTDANEYKGSVMDVANAPGEQILPGELSLALQIIAEGGDVDSQGATGVELVCPGEAAGSYQEFEVKDGALSTICSR